MLFLVAPGVASGQKTDSVWIRNGDRITGEVKSLSRGLLKYSTADLGTISIEWDKVARISTTTILEVQLHSGRKFYGRLGDGPAGSLVLGVDTLPLAEAVAMVPIEEQLLSRLSGYLDLGFSYQKAHKTAQLSSGARVVYRAPRVETTLELTTFLEDRDDAARTSRFTGSLTERLFPANRWSAGVVLGYDRNDELDLAGRGRLVGFGTRMLTQSNHAELRASGGLVLAREEYFSTDSTISGVEGLLATAFRAFRYDQPKLDSYVSVQAFPSFSIQGRVRLQTDLRVSYELVEDFMLTGSVFDSYDSKPQAAGAEKNDFGTTLAITWSF
jgi:hypothetical protein